MNEREIQSLKHNPAGKNQSSLSNSLYLRVYKKTKTFVLRKKVEGKEIVVTLGHYPDMRFRDTKIEAAKYPKKSVTADRMSNIIDRYKDVVVYPRSKVPKKWKAT